MSSRKDVLLRPARVPLKAAGWRKQAGLGNIYLRELRPGVVAWLALGGHWGGGYQHLDARPRLGVRHDTEERHAASLLGVDPDRSSAPTIMGDLARLVPSRIGSQDWRLYVADGDDNADTWRTVMEDIDQHATPWWEERTSDEQLVAAIRRGEGNDTARLVLPLLLLALGRPDAARQAVESGRGRHTGLVVDYDAYATRLLAEIDAT